MTHHDPSTAAFLALVSELTGTPATLGPPRRRDPLAVRCDHCAAAPGEPCRTVRPQHDGRPALGRRPDRPHLARRNAARPSDVEETAMSTETATAQPATTDRDHGAVPVDSGHLLIVDPCHLPPALVDALTRPNRYGVTLAVMLETPSGDGMFDVFSFQDGEGDDRSAVLMIGDGYGDLFGRGWTTATL
ncbi:zinc finger domain-containing protein [Micromonospora ureilytica]|uniref:DNA-binding phage zinc finger domain-containing protein n=1 Tax=Micromonospora ureilytica TaxID=709868 RepID=A0ABS0JLD6_9ACTN|nr:hypothetical protein [Micromonospora ureilytica]MBG6067863.1 hypothetical protein [Micromonospora ureilytica]